MRIPPIVMAIVLLILPAAPAFEATFTGARLAYDDGRYAEASLLYESILSNGVSNVEVHYNLANAFFKNGQLPEAVWHYRTAWANAPRDPDIRANLHFALNAAGAAEPSSDLLGKTGSLLSRSEWIGAATGAYLAFILLLLLSLLMRPARRILLRLSLLPAAAILLSAGGWWHWKQLQEHPEAVVIRSGATALFGPVEGSTAHYELPLAALVRQRSSDGKGWVEIEYDERKGWLKEQYIRRVSP